MIATWAVNPELVQVEREIMLLVRERNLAQQELRERAAEPSEVLQTLRPLDLKLSRLEWRRRSLPRQIRLPQPTTDNPTSPEAA